MQSNLKLFPETSGYAQLDFQPSDRGVYLQHHTPHLSLKNYHLHADVEMNFLQDCSMTYSFSGTEVRVPEGRFCVFWAAIPHGVTRVFGKGTITNCYISLSELLRWSLPKDFVADLLGRSFMISKEELPGDRPLVNRWSKEVDRSSQEWQRLHALELRSRLLRIALEGWDKIPLVPYTNAIKGISDHTAASFDKMLSFIAIHYADNITLTDVAKAGGISDNYAITLFRRLLGRTVKSYIVEFRITNAKMQLVNGGDKIINIAMDCGFGSESSFYEAFKKYVGITPAMFRNAEKN